MFATDPLNKIKHKLRRDDVISGTTFRDGIRVVRYVLNIAQAM